MKNVMQKISISFVILVIILLGSTTMAGSQPVGATNSVTICHATSSNTNPYNVETPNVQNDGSLTGGHLNHTGGIYPSNNWGDIIPPYSYQTYDAVGSHQEVDKYVCPSDNSAYTSTDSTKDCKTKISNVWYYADKIATYKTVTDYAWVTHTYTGMNWTTDGQAIWNNNCAIPTTTVTPTATPSATPTVTVTPTATPSAIPTVTDTPTPTPTSTSSNNSSDTSGSNNSSNNSSSNNSQPTQAVLAASTMAATGTFDTTLMNFMWVAGMMVLAAGSISYAKEKKN